MGVQQAYASSSSMQKCSKSTASSIRECNKLAKVQQQTSATDKCNKLKPGIYKWLGLDRWTHYETCCKVGENAIYVIEKFVWHDRKSCAENEYQVSAKGSNGLVRTNGQCNIQMLGLRYP